MMTGSPPAPGSAHRRSRRRCARVAGTLAALALLTGAAALALPRSPQQAPRPLAPPSSPAPSTGLLPRQDVAVKITLALTPSEALPAAVQLRLLEEAAGRVIAAQAPSVTAGRQPKGPAALLDAEALPGERLIAVRFVANSLRGAQTFDRAGLIALGRQVIAAWTRDLAATGRALDASTRARRAALALAARQANPGTRARLTRQFAELTAQAEQLRARRARFQDEAARSAATEAAARAEATALAARLKDVVASGKPALFAALTEAQSDAIVRAIHAGAMRQAATTAAATADKARAQALARLAALAPAVREADRQAEAAQALTAFDRAHPATSYAPCLVRELQDGAAFAD